MHPINGTLIAAATSSAGRLVLLSLVIIISRLGLGVWE
jgi:hypothetical protein